MTAPTASQYTDATATPRLLLTVEEAAARLSVSRTRMYGLLRDNAIFSIRMGRLRRIPADALHEFTAHLTATQPNQTPRPTEN